jgi:cytoskeletal protein CcmA (bactofilin family)
MFKKRGRASPRAADVTTLIDEGSEIEGKFTFSGTVLVNGRLRGEIVSSDSLIIGTKGVVNASIRASVVRVEGEVVGNITATDRLELAASARVFGDVSSPVVCVDEGALLEGRCHMTTTADLQMQQARDASVVPLKREERRS